MFRLLVVIVLGWLTATTVVAAPTALLDLAKRQHYAEPAEAKLSQYQLLRQLQQVGALHEQAESPARQKQLAETYSNIGRNYARLGLPVLAAFYYDQAWRMEPAVAERQYDLAIELIGIGDTAVGEQLLQQALTGSTNNHRRQRLLASGLIQLGKHTEAAKVLLGVLRNSRVADDQHYAYQLLNGLQSLLPENERERVTAPSSRESSAWPALLSRELQNTDEQALSDYLQSLQQRDTMAFREQLCEALFYRGLQWQNSGAPDTAKAYFQAAITMNLPSFFESQLARFFLYRLQPAVATPRASSWDPNPIG